MAFPEEPSYPAAGPKAAGKPSVTELAPSTLFALILQIGGGILALYYALPSVIVIPIVFPMLVEMFPFISEMIAPILVYCFMMVWTMLSIMGILQIYAGYKMYKMVPGAIRRAIQIDVVVIVLYGIDTFISAYGGILLLYPTVVIYLAANILLVYLLNMQSVRNELGSGERLQSELQPYSG